MTAQKRSDRILLITEQNGGIPQSPEKKFPERSLNSVSLPIFCFTLATLAADSQVGRRINR
jgi:hypothetical protein